MKAIQTRYYGPTNTKPSKIKAWAEGVAPVYVTYGSLPDDLSGEAAFRYVAEQLAAKYGWANTLVGGGLPNGDYAFCMVPK